MPKPFNMQEMKRILTAMAEVEKAIAKLYKLCAEVWQEDRTFWLDLEGQELVHAGIISKIAEIVFRKEDHFEINRPFNTAAMKTFISGIENRMEQVRQGEVARPQMLAIALDVERSLLEAKYAEMFKTDDIEYRKLLSTILNDTRRHRRLIEEKLEKTA
jgi:rubrerythrin